MGITVGNEAVIVFFVLSGYLVGGSAIKAVQRNRWSWKTYLIKRLTRLWVVLIPALIFGVALDFAGIHHFSAPTAIYAGPPGQRLVSKDLSNKLTAPVIAANAVFLQSIRTRTAGTNDSLWSLANEFWYYIAFPLFLLSLRKGEKPVLRGAYLLAAVGIALFVGRTIDELFFVWVLGALLAVVPLRMPLRAAKIAGGLTALALPIWFVLVRRAPLSLYGAEWMVAVYFAIVLYLILHQTEGSRAGIYRTVSSFFSRISYTLYLVHLPLAVFICASLNNPWHHWSKSPKNLALFGVLNVFLILFAYVFYLAFEANTDRVRVALFHRDMPERHLPTRRDDIAA